MNPSERDVLNEWERRAWQQLVGDFPTELLCLDDSLGILGSCIAILIQSQPMLQHGDVLGSVRAAEGDTQREAVWTMLLCEAIERFESTRLLILAGHQSRSLSCARDAFECLLWADACLKDKKQAVRWLKRKKVVVRPDYAYPLQLAKEIDSGIQRVLNTWGTHAYLDACYLSLHATPPNLLGDNAGASEWELYRYLTQRSLISILHLIGSAIEYVGNTKEFPEQLVMNGRLVLLQINGCVDKFDKSCVARGQTGDNFIQLPDYPAD